MMICGKFDGSLRSLLSSGITALQLRSQFIPFGRLEAVNLPNLGLPVRVYAIYPSWLADVSCRPASVQIRLVASADVLP